MALIDVIKGHFTAGGARQTMYVVTVAGIDPVLVSAASMPAATIGVIEVPYRGRLFPLPGDRAANGTFSFELLGDDDMDGYKAMAAWSNECNDFANNTVSPAFREVTIQGLNNNGDVTVTCNLHDAWPSELGEISYSASGVNTLVTASCTLTYSWADYS